MFERIFSHRLVFTVAIVLAAAMAGCGQKAEETAAVADTTIDTSAEVIAEPFEAVVDLPADSPAELARKKQEIISWTPQQADRINYALEGVTRVVRFADLGLGDEAEFALPRQGSAGWPIVNSLRLKLGREKTALVVRFHIDTLPGPRVRGEGMLGLIGIHCDTLFGRDIELPRTAASTGRFEVLFLAEQLFAQLSYIGIPTFALGRYGTIRDTMTLIFTFSPSRANYLISLIGPDAGRPFPGHQYDQFRTERGEFHRELKDFPYVYVAADSSYVNLFIGSRWRGRKSQLEPVLRLKMF